MPAPTNTRTSTRPDTRTNPQPKTRSLRRACIALSVTLSAAAAFAAEPSGDSAKPEKAPGGTKVKVEVKTQPAAPATLDHSGRKRTGKASFYSRKFSGRKMADGTPMNPNSNVAASKTLPIGTTAKVTNLKTGQSTVVEIRDRGPYVKGRIVDLSPKTAKEIGAAKDGVVPVEVTPIEVPQANGSMKQGAAAGEPASGRK